MKYVLTTSMIIPAGTELVVSDILGAGGLEAQSEFGLVRVFLGRASALEQGLVVARPELNLVVEINP